jgi:hypothetical protein
VFRSGVAVADAFVVLLQASGRTFSPSVSDKEARFLALHEFFDDDFRARRRRNAPPLSMSSTADICLIDRSRR